MSFLMTNLKKSINKLNINLVEKNVASAEVFNKVHEGSSVIY